MNDIDIDMSRAAAVVLALVVLLHVLVFGAVLGLTTRRPAAPWRYCLSWSAAEAALGAFLGVGYMESAADWMLWGGLIGAGCGAVLGGVMWCLRRSRPQAA